MDFTMTPVLFRLILCIKDQWIRQSFIISMCDIKFWKGFENLRPIYKKPFFEILSGFLHFAFPISIHFLYYEVKTFFIWISRMGYQKISVADPDPPDPRVFGPPWSGSGSTSQRYGSGSCSGSGSFYHHAKLVRKTLIPTILRLFLNFYLWKLM
jgi:hypothetical protein